MTNHHGRITAFGNQLIQIHVWLREEINRIIDDIESNMELADSKLTSTLAAHCLAFCSAVDRHHTGEDAVAFPALAEQFPELAPVLAELERDHGQVAAMLRRVQELVSEVAGRGAGPVLAELQTLAVLLESHFLYEEKKLVPALNALDQKLSTERLLGVDLPREQ